MTFNLDEIQFSYQNGELLHIHRCRKLQYFQHFYPTMFHLRQQCQVEVDGFAKNCPA